MSSTLHNDLFSILISEIKSYSGKDPLLPWLKGIRQMKDCLPPQLLNEKLPRFLQKCAQTFVTNRLYRNDMRYLRVWLHLMDYVDDPKVLLRTMEMNHIGMKQSLFYQAYALYYEKIKKFDDAEKMYLTGVQNFAEPLGELQKSYDQFLHRMERHKNKRIQREERKTIRRPLSGTLPRESIPETLPNNVTVKGLEERSSSMIPRKKSKNIKEVGQNVGKMFRGDGPAVAKSLDTSIVENSEAEYSFHHGLVDPTINMKEAMNAINSMFREPIESSFAGRRSHKNRLKENQSLNNGFHVFVDDSLGNEHESSHQEHKSFSLPQHIRGESSQSHQESFEIYVDDEENEEEDNFNSSDAFVFQIPKEDVSFEPAEDQGRSPREKFHEDTVVCRFVGSTIMDEPEVENVCHHGLVDPTINLKEAMADINNMFGKPMEFVRANRRKKQDNKAVNKTKENVEFSIFSDNDEFKPDQMGDSDGFSILPDDDDDIEPQQESLVSKTSVKSSESDLFEPTVFTREAIDEINKMFGMPLDF